FAQSSNPPADAGSGSAVPPDAPPPDAPPSTPSPAEQAKPITVSGRVIDKLGQPIRNAKVGVEGSDDQVRTDRGGRFSTKAPVNSTLVVEKNGLEVGLAIVTGPVLEDIVLLDLDTVGEQIEIQGSAPVAAPGAAVIDRSELQ